MGRQQITMSDEETRTFLETGRTLQVATIGGDGFPHLAPLWYVLDDDRVVFRSFTKSQKIVNLERDPRLAVLVETGEAYAELRGVMIRGRGRLVTDHDYVLSIYGRLAERHPMVGGRPRRLTGEELESSFGGHAAKNTAVVVEPERIATWDHTKLTTDY